MDSLHRTPLPPPVHGSASFNSRPKPPSRLGSFQQSEAQNPFGGYSAPINTSPRLSSSYDTQVKNPIDMDLFLRATLKLVFAFGRFAQYASVIRRTWPLVAVIRYIYLVTKTIAVTIFMLLLLEGSTNFLFLPSLQCRRATHVVKIYNHAPSAVVLFKPG